MYVTVLEPLMKMPKQNTSFLHLPPEIQEHIFLMTDVDTLRWNCTRAHPMFKVMIESLGFWKSYVRRQGLIPEKVEKILDLLTWEEAQKLAVGKPFGRVSSIMVTILLIIITVEIMKWNCSK